MPLWTPGTKTPAPHNDHSGRYFKSPERDGYRLPIEIVSPEGLTEEDLEFLEAMLEFEPHTKLRPGDMAYLLDCPPYVRNRLKTTGRMVPLIWKVRFIVSAWAFELHQMAHAIPDRIAGVDHAFTLMEGTRLRPDKYTHAVIYAHAMPHGMWPDTACWFPNRALKKVMVQDSTPPWPTVLDEAKAPFVGYDNERIMRPFIWSMAPDLYGDGENIGKPLPSEEAAIHTACLLGMESFLLGDLSRGVDPYYVGNDRLFDPEHDLFKGK